MKIIRSVDFTYILYEEENGEFVMDLVVPTPTNAWANYEKRVVLGRLDSMLIMMFPERADRLARKLIGEEKRRIQTGEQSGEK